MAISETKGEPSLPSKGRPVIY